MAKKVVKKKTSRAKVKRVTPKAVKKRDAVDQVEEEVVEASMYDEIDDVDEIMLENMIDEDGDR